MIYYKIKEVLGTLGGWTMSLSNSGSIETVWTTRMQAGSCAMMQSAPVSPKLHGRVRRAYLFRKDLG